MLCSFWKINGMLPLPVIKVSEPTRSCWHFDRSKNAKKSENNKTRDLLQMREYDWLIHK